MALYTEQQYNQKKKIYGILASLPIIAAILHLLANVWMMSTINYHPETNDYSVIYTLGEMFSSSSLATMIAASVNDAKTVSTITSIISIAIALILIFLSTSAVKGNKISFMISAGVYLLDDIMMIPCIIYSCLTSNAIHLAVYDIILMILVHLVVSGLFVWGILIGRRLDQYLAHLSLVENEIHINQ